MRNILYRFLVLGSCCCHDKPAAYAVAASTATTTTTAIDVDVDVDGSSTVVITKSLDGDDADGSDNDSTKREKNNKTKSGRPKTSNTYHPPDRVQVGKLTPSDLPGPTIFTNYERNETLNWTTSKGVPIKQTFRIGSVTQIDSTERGNVSSEFTFVPQLIPQDDIERMLELLRSYDEYDIDPDTVDGMPTYEMFLDNPELSSNKNKESGGGGPKINDYDPEALQRRTPLREQLNNITRVLLKERITPYVHERYPDICKNQKGGDSNSRVCTPCYSLIRRYRHGERQSHATHYDGHAIVTVVVSLSEYGRDYRGGLYLSTGYGQQREFLPLNQGDAAVHRSTLLHGVQVYDNNNHDDKEQPQKKNNTERWSWILWFRDSSTCDDHSHEWFADCANAGNALCQSLHATKVGNIPGIDSVQASKQILDLNIKAAQGGVGSSAIKVARAYLKRLPSTLPYNEDKAKQYFQMAIDSYNPDGHYGMAELILAEIRKRENDEVSSSGKGSQKKTSFLSWKESQLRNAVWHLEEAARLHHSYGMFNLGMAHVYGYGMPNNRIDADLAAEWFIQSGLPEGYMIAAHQAASIGDTSKQQQYFQRAQVLGFSAPWRKQAREATGSGGASGVDLNLPWPRAYDGRVPPKV